MTHYEYYDAADAPKHTENPGTVPNGRGLRDILKFETNVPVACSLKYRKPKVIETQRGPRAMFTLTLPSAVMFLDRDVAFKIEKLEVKPGEVFWVCRRNTGERGALDSWDVYLDPATERSRSASAAPSPETAAPVSNALNASSNSAEDSTKKTGAKEARIHAPETCGTIDQPITNSESNRSQIHLGWAKLLTSVSQTLVDVYAASLAYSSEKHGNAVKPEDVRTMVVTAFIQQSKGGPSHA